MKTLLMWRSRGPALVVLTGWALSLSAAAWAQGGMLRMDEEVEHQVESAIVYLTVTYHKTPGSTADIEVGSGFFVNSTCLITNYHVIEGALKGYRATVEARVLSGTAETRVYQPNILAVNQDLDLALLQIPTRHEGIYPLRIAPGLPGKQVEIYAFGFPLGSLLDRSSNGPNVSLRRGYVSRIINDGTAVEADINLDKGISGGPLTDHQGNVRGMVRSIAGSTANRNYAGIAISSPLLLEFCQSHGARVTLTDGTVVVSETPLPPPLPTGQEIKPNPRRSAERDLLRAYFAAGSQLRLSTLIPQMLMQQNKAFSEDLQQQYHDNLEQIISHLTMINAPDELLQRGGELVHLLVEDQVDVALLAEKATVMEKVSDEWINHNPGDGQLNYMLGAWLTELSLGLVAPESDLKNVSYFVETGDKQRSSAEVMKLLRRIQQRLETLSTHKDDEEKRALSKDADRLLGIGLMAAEGDKVNQLPKSARSTSTPTTGNNPIRRLRPQP
jgi:hypothetical protein